MSFTSLLTANRGEIACRIARTARAEGLRVIAVYSDADETAPHVAEADEAVRIGPAPVAESYLNAHAILDAAQRAGAEAVHPGYGFLSENAAFAEAVIKAGLVWVGPPPDAIRAMGDKAAAKRLLGKADVPLVPGYEGTAQTDKALQKAAADIGFPLMIKAAAGGGGRGMRRVYSDTAFMEALTTAQSEAKNAFGSDAIILEKLIEGARHVEVQVVADKHGNTVHLGERDCSVQRRHQKIIEEAPSPAVTPALRAAMGLAAVNAAKAVDYEGAGTVEFLLDKDGKFYFLEMNTRLQVEHPVTEEVTGHDLVALQLAVARGEALSDLDSEPEGNAIEVRLYAEDPAHGFLPQTGELLAFDIPPGARLDTGTQAGSTVSAFYDPMLAKLITHGANREEACARMIAALEGAAILGVTTNRDFLIDVLKSEEFANGTVTTDFLDSWRAPAPNEAECTHALALAAALIVFRDGGLSWRSAGEASVPLRLALGEETYDLRVTGRFGEMTVTLGDAAFSFSLSGTAGAVRVMENGAERVITTAVSGDHLYFADGARTWSMEDVTYAPPEAAAGAAGAIRAPMAGRIVSIRAEEGGTAQKGAIIVTLEAMKMEHELTAMADATVEAIHVAEGDQVAAKQLLVTLAAAG